MRLANLNNERSPPSPGLKGACPACGEQVIAKCGDQRVHHWAHRGKRVCDRWWEPETEWHRNWKLNFPEEWQEVVLRDGQNGEKHIADVRTAHGLTIEFQHSNLRPEECIARETFHGKMVWVVDGLRLKRDLPRFVEGVRELRSVAGNDRVFMHRFPEELFPKTWLGRQAPVYFDFGTASAGAPIERWLWCLLPQRDGDAVIVRLAREEFVLAAREDPMLLLGYSVQADVDRWLVEQRRRSQQNLLRELAALQQMARWPRHSRRRARPRIQRKRIF